MKRRFFYVFLLAFIPVLASAQDDEERMYSIGIKNGIDNNINAYRFDANTEGNVFHSSNKPYYNFGFDFGIFVSKKIRTRFGIGYAEMGYNADWDNTSLTSSYKKTEIRLFNFDMDANMDYLLFAPGKFQLFVSPGLRWEVAIDKEVKNIKVDGTHNYKQYNDIIKESPNSILGGTVSTILKYNLTKGIGITLTPTYTMFFRGFVRSNDKLYQRFTGNVGVEFAF